MNTSPRCTVNIENFAVRRVPKEHGWLALIALGPGYSTNLIFYKKGSSGPLQFHPRKDETTYLYQGKAVIRYIDASTGLLTETIIDPGTSIHIPPGAVHQFEALEDCLVIEGSNDVFDDRVNLENGFPTARKTKANKMDFGE